MQITPTTAFAATRDDQHIIIEVQKDVQLRLTVHEAMHLGRSASRAAALAMEEARHIEPQECEVIAFTRRAAGRA